MDYRDERDALRGRVESLEDQLAATKKELAAAQEPPAPPSASSAAASRTAFQRLGIFGALFGGFWAFVFTPLMLTALGPLVVPPMARLAAPIVCPEGYARSTVETWSSSQGDGESSEHWELRCVDAAGVEHAAPDVPTWAMLLAISEAAVIASLGAVFFVFVIGSALRRRRRASQILSEPG